MRLLSVLETLTLMSLSLMPTCADNQIMADGHLSSWNLGNGLCKVKLYNRGVVMTSLLLHWLCVLSVAVTRTIWTNWKRLVDHGRSRACECVNLLIRCFLNICIFGF